MRFPAFFAKLPDGPRYYARGLFHELTTKDVFLWAQAFAFKVLVSLVPMLVLATGIAGRVLRMDKPFEIVASFVEDFLPSYQSDSVLKFLDGLAQASGTITIVGGIGLLVASMSVLTTLRIVISNVFQEDYHKARPILRGYAFDLRMVLQVGALFLLIFVFLVLTEWVHARGEQTLAWLGWNADWITAGWATLFVVIAQLVPLLLGMLMFAQLYYFIPTPHPPRASVWRGAFVTAILWEISKRAFTFYAVRANRFDLEGGFGVMLALVFWIYYSGIVLIVGAIIVLLSEKRGRAAAGLGTRPKGRASPEPASARFDTAPAPPAPAA
ncbi:MAG: YihY/virulence factor BrkB family protein [Rhodothermales bacterium]|nr:YihY/virulence factor BrkB family protein [Rhodothermales bacterium]